MAFTDADEFLVIKDGTADLPALLRDYEGFGGLAIIWQVRFASALVSHMMLCSDYTRVLGSDHQHPKSA